MGIFNKLKGILFEEVEEEETPQRVVKNETKRPIAEKIEPQRKTYEENVSRVEPKVNPQPQVQKEVKKDTFSDPELFSGKDNFPFQDFDEAEFSAMSRVQKQKSKPTTNVLEYEKKKKTEKKYDFGRYERIERTEVVEKKKFKPSPIISPVYGILHEDYKPEDIKDKTNNNMKVDFNSVRKKAFGEPESLEPKTTYYEEKSVTVKLKDDKEEDNKKFKTIDDLLEDTADVTIEIPKNDNTEVVGTDVEDYEKIDEDLEDLSNNEVVKEEKEEVEENDDTLENDLFDLIDSMYDNREDGE